MAKGFISFFKLRVPAWLTLLFTGIIYFLIVQTFAFIGTTKVTYAASSDEQPVLLTHLQFEAALKQEVDALISAKKLRSATVYLEDLTSGEILNLNSEENYSPCSLLKIFTMLDVLKAAEAKPDILQTKIKYQGKKENFLVNIDGKTLKPGNYYTLDSLLYYMINQSDNEAAGILFKMCRENQWEKSESKVHLNYSGINAGSDFINISKIMLCLKTIYKREYLNEEMNKKAVGYLSNSLFCEGIATGLPGGIVVAHKFGELPYKKSELHDCGIVYLEGRPYLLGIMTKGLQLQDEVDAIVSISKMVYEYMYTTMPKA